MNFVSPSDFAFAIELVERLNSLLDKDSRMSWLVGELRNARISVPKDFFDSFSTMFKTGVPMLGFVGILNGMMPPGIRLATQGPEDREDIDRFILLDDSDNIIYPK